MKATPCSAATACAQPAWRSRPRRVRPSASKRLRGMGLHSTGVAPAARISAM
jgi:hypothetical protein